MVLNAVTTVYGAFEHAENAHNKYTKTCTYGRFFGNALKCVMSIGRVVTAGTVILEVTCDLLTTKLEKIGLLIEPKTSRL